MVAARRRAASKGPGDGQRIRRHTGPAVPAFDEGDRSLAAPASGGTIRRLGVSSTRDGDPLPAALRAGVEGLSGIAMDDVRVHYDSSQPARIGALAYAHRTDIHLAPGQSEHLAHEAWHVVQQKRGLVTPTLQLQGRAVNVDNAAEAEADHMGAAAAHYRGHSAESPVVHRPARGAVVQPRMAAMTEDQIKANPRLAQELLLHRIQTIPDQEYAVMKKEAPRLQPTSWFLEQLRSERLSTDLLIMMYPMWHKSTTDETRFTPEPAGSHEPTAEQYKAIVSQLRTVGRGMGTTMKNEEALTRIFGVKPDKLDPIVKVFEQARELLGEHYSDKTCPVLELGNSVHNNWVGVAGMTQYGAKRIDLGAPAVAMLAAGSVDGHAGLVHELTHAAAGTDDLAYGLMQMAKLGPTSRANNASHYEHAYLETMGVKNPARYYDPVVSIGQQQQGESPQAAMRKKKVKAATNLLAEMWNTLDNCYLAAQRIHDQPGRTAEQARLDEMLRSLGAYPHAEKGKTIDTLAAMALIEDRTRYLHDLKDINVLRPHILKFKDKELEDLDASQFIASVLTKELRLGGGTAEVWVHHLLKPKEWVSAHQ